MMYEFIQGDAFEILPMRATQGYDAIITDVPYDLKPDEKQFLHREFLRISKGVIIVFSPPENQWVLPANQYLFWCKPISTKNTSRSYSRFVEMIFVYNVTTWNCHNHWSNYVNIFEDRVDTVKAHPYRKPLSLLRRLIINHTNDGDLILDPFCGSHSLRDAAIGLDRHIHGIDQVHYV